MGTRKRAQLGEIQVVDLLGKYIDDQITFERVYSILSPTKDQHTAITIMVKSNGRDTTIKFLEQVHTV